MNDAVPYDAITTMLVFLIGLPAIVFQWLPPEVRQIIVRRPGELLLDAGLPIALGLMIVTAAIIVPLANDLWPGILGALFVLSLFTAFRIPIKYVRRPAIVGRLARRALRPKDTQNPLDERALMDLIELGRQSQPGEEKQLVLEQLLGLARTVCAAEHYDGDQLAELLVGVLEVAVRGPQTGSTQNLATAADALKQPLRHFDHNTPGFKQTDLLHSVRALSRIGREAIRIDSESVPMAVVQALGSTGAQHPATAVATSRALFEIGVDAVERNHVLTGMSAVQSSLALVDSNGVIRSNDVVADALGLLAHFWASGETARRYAASHLAELADTIPDDIQAALQAAAEHCARTTQFTTSDKVLAMAAEYRP